MNTPLKIIDLIFQALEARGEKVTYDGDTKSGSIIIEKDGGEFLISSRDVQDITSAGGEK